MEQFHSRIAENELNISVLGLIELLVSSETSGFTSLNFLLIKIWLLPLFKGMERFVCVHMCGVPQSSLQFLRIDKGDR